MLCDVYPISFNETLPRIVTTILCINFMVFLIMPAFEDHEKKIIIIEFIIGLYLMWLYNMAEFGPLMKADCRSFDISIKYLSLSLNSEINYK